MIRVLHYGMSPNLGGIETYLLNLAKTIDSSRFQFDFLYSDQGQEPVFAGELTARGSRFFGVTPRRVSPRRNRADLEALFAREQFDILHFHANTASYVEPVRAALKHGVKVVYHSHNAGASRSRVTRLLHRWNLRSLPWDSIARVAVSGEAGRWMFGSRPFDVIHNGIDVDAFAFRPDARERVRAELGLAPDAFVVGSVAAFLPAKNHQFLLEIFAEIARRRPTASLLLVGSGPSEVEVRLLVERLELRERVLFLGRRSDVADILCGMDRMLLPSLHEGFPIVTLEAQACGLTCLMSDSITQEVAVSPFVHSLSLSQSALEWADALAASGGESDRLSGQIWLRDSGLDRAAATRRVEALYRAEDQPHKGRLRK